MLVVGGSKKKMAAGRIDLDVETSLNEEVTLGSSVLVDWSGRIKIVKPDLFDRNREKFKQFSMQVDLYLAFNRSKFTNDTQKSL